MVNIEKTVQCLLAKFEDRTEFEKRKLVFWYDNEGTVWSPIEQAPRKDLETIKQELANKGIKFILLDNNYFQVKKLLEEDDTKSNYLIYSQKAEPQYKENWLLDIQLYSSRYESSKLADIKSELDIEGYQLDKFFEENLSFFASKKRVTAYKKRHQSDWRDEDCYLGLFSVLANSQTTDINEMLRKILVQSFDDNDNPIWMEILKFKLSERFWTSMKHHFGFYTVSPTLKKLFLSFLITHINRHSSITVSGYEHYRNTQESECEVFLKNWMNHIQDSQAFNNLCKQMLEEDNHELEREITSELMKHDITDCLTVESVDIVDKIIIRQIATGITSGSDTFEDYQNWIQQRTSTHWFPIFKNLYLATESAVNLSRFAHGFSTDTISKLSLKELFEEYTRYFHQMDLHYRNFYSNYDKNQEKEVLKKELQPYIEQLYSNRLQKEFLEYWSNAIDREVGETWKVDFIDSQQKFYDVYVKDVLAKNDRDRVAVIISDGLRYEVAVELQQVLDRETLGDIELKAMAGVVPSYTQLGMASLLPHKSLTYEDGKILADGMSTQGIDNRSKVLRATLDASCCFNFGDLMKLKAEEAREKIKGKRVVYIYHNRIDDVGDKPQSEHEVFKAAEETINELTMMINSLGRSWNMNKVIITADHGFLYIRGALENVDKLDVPASIRSQIMDQNKRYLISSERIQINNSHQFDLASIFGAGTLFANIPKGDLRFKLKGGGRNYVHGGVSPQEIIIPVLIYSHRRQEIDLERKGIRYGKVKISVINTGRKITSNPFMVNLYQIQPVTEKLEPLECKIGLWDLTDGKRKVSEEKRVIFNNTSVDPEDRQEKINIHLSSKIENRVYYLRIIDEDEKALKRDIIDPIPFVVDLIIIDDF